MNISPRFILPFSLVGVFAIGCGDDTGTGGSGAGGGGTGDACAPASGCPEVVSDCLAFVDNTDKPDFALRIGELQVEAPAALATSTIEGILNTGVTLDYPSCQSADGFSYFTKDGTFNWILEFDTSTNTLRTGGAVLETDPTKGYCFLTGEIAGFDVSPLEVPITVGEGGAVTVEGAADVVVPIYADPTDLSKVILLPLRGVQITDTTLTSNNNCIGSFNASGLDPNNLCLPDAETPMFTGGGRLSGHITLEEADQVLVPQLSNSSLCALIAGADFTDQATKKCRRDGTDAIEFQGDWCAGAAEGDPGGPATGTCFDAVQLEAGYSAFAVALRTDC